MDLDEMRFKEACDGCGHHLGWIATAYVCTAEDTWCPECAEGAGMVCPACSDELRKRPRRTRPLGG